MNDVVREVGGTLGIAVLGSILTSGYGSAWTTPWPACPPEPPPRRATASARPTRSPRDWRRRRRQARSHLADSAFVNAMSTTATIAAAVAVIGALIALVFLPARARDEAPVAALAPVAADQTNPKMARAPHGARAGKG